VNADFPHRPHHDIYSIEDLSAADFDLKSQSAARWCRSQTVCRAWVLGTIAAGVAKA